MVSFLYLLVALGSLQGLVTAVLLYLKKPSRLSLRLLTILVLLIALPGIHLYGHYAKLFNDSLPADILHAVVPWVSVMAVGPLFYYYVRASTDPSFSASAVRPFHFLPLLIDLFPKLMEMVFLVGGLSPWSRDVFTGYLDMYNMYADIPRWLSFAYYIFLSGGYLRAVQAPVRITRFVFAMKILAGIWFLYLIPYLIPSMSRELHDTVGWFPVYLPMSVLIYWIGITTMHNPVPDIVKKTESAAYAPGLLEDIARKLAESMETEKAYLDPSMDLTLLSRLLQVPPKLVSAAVNQVLNKSFNQFVNEYRVQAFKTKILEETNRNITITGLAASCGFSSAATFQRSFKQITGLTPTEFLRSALKSLPDTAQIRI